MVGTATTENMDAKLEELADAAQAGEVTKIRTLLSGGASVNGKDRGGFPLLHRCCVGGNADAASLLLARGASANAVDEVRSTILGRVAQLIFSPVCGPTVCSTAIQRFTTHVILDIAASCASCLQPAQMLLQYPLMAGRRYRLL